jgi:hypothetical protein
MMDIDALASDCLVNAVNHGFYEEYNKMQIKLSDDPELWKFFERIWLSNRLMLIVSELAEALEAVRHNNMGIDPSSGGFGEELADTQIRLADLAEHTLNSSFSCAVRNKMNYNASRPYKHGRSL